MWTSQALHKGLGTVKQKSQDVSRHPFEGTGRLVPMSKLWSTVPIRIKRKGDYDGEEDQFQRVTQRAIYFNPLND